MELAMGAMGPLLTKLYELLTDEYIAQRGLKGEIKSLSDEMGMMYAVLDEVSRVPPDKLSKPDKLWAQRVRELSYDMEDAVDSFIVRVAARQPAGSDDANAFKKFTSKATKLIKKVKHRHQLSDKIKEIKTISKQLGELRVKYSFTGAAPANCTGVDPRLINLYKNKGELVGTEEAKDELIRRLRYPEDDKSLKIVSIVGCGGLGKTTIAQLVHDHLKPQSFDCSAFVSVGRNPNITNTLREMLEELDEKYSTKVNTASWKEARFCKELHKFLRGKRYNIVVDDVWETETWETINCALPENDCASKVVITTRNSEVGAKAGDVYKLRPLSHDKSKELFYKRTSGSDGDNQLVDEIIDKCDGVPLSIIAIASLLVDRSLEDWQNVYDSIIFGCEEDKTRTILLYSYYDLPSYLKPCLLYLSMYPEDREIEKYSLIWRWIAEGFVQLGKEGGTLFEVGERYFNELLNRSMVQPVEDQNDSVIEGCRIHDIVLDLIRDLSAEENFVTIFVEKQHGLPECVTKTEEVGLHGFVGKVRRLSIQRCHVEDISQDTLGMPVVVRSLDIVSSEHFDMALVSRFQACRVLVIDCKNTRNLKHLGKLLHLRYLEIVTCSSEGYRFPKEIENLKSLHTLRLKHGGGSYHDELPPPVCELRQLRCLHAKVRTVATDSMGKLKCLEKLDLEVTCDEDSEVNDFVLELCKLTKLRVLKIRFWFDMTETSKKAVAHSLSNLQEIRELNIWFRQTSTTTVAVWEGWEPPRRLLRLNMRDWSFSLRMMNPSRFQYLCHLYLEIHVVEEKDLENLAQLPELLYLNLSCDKVHQGFVVGASAFKKLRVCKVQTTFIFLQGAAPRLETLCLAAILQRSSFCLSDISTREAIPDLDFGLGNLILLKEVNICVNCENSFPAEVEEAEDAVKRAVEEHPNRPTFEIRRNNEDAMLSNDDVKPDNVVRLPLSARDFHFSQEEHVKAMLHYRWLEKITYDIDCEGATYFHVLGAEESMRNVATCHPNRPILQTNLINEDKLEPVEFTVWWELKYDDLFDYTKAGWYKYRFPEKISLVINCEDARLSEVEKLESALRHGFAVHRDRPILLMSRKNEDKMVSDSCSSELGGHDGPAGDKTPPVSNDAKEQDMRGDTQWSPELSDG